MDFEFSIPSDMQIHGRRTRAACRGQEKDDEEEEEEEEEEQEEDKEEGEEGCCHRVLPYPLSSLGTTTEKENQHRMSNFTASAMPVHNGSIYFGGPPPPATATITAGSPASFNFAALANNSNTSNSNSSNYHEDLSRLFGSTMNPLMQHRFGGEKEKEKEKEEYG